MLSPTHLVLLAFIILVALVVFGPKRLPELGQGLGKAIQEFRKASAAAADEIKTVTTSVTATSQEPTETTTEVRSMGVGDHAGSSHGSESVN